MPTLPPSTAVELDLGALRGFDVLAASRLAGWIDSGITLTIAGSTRACAELVELVETFAQLRAA